MEMTVVLFILLLLLMGVVEFGNLMNEYINLVDGVREGARFGSNNDPFELPDGSVNYSVVQTSFYENIDQVIEGFGTEEAAGSISPLVLDESRDDILISFISTQDGDVLATYGPWCKYCNGQTSRLLNDPGFIEGSLNEDAPNTGILIVEIFYAYDQLLNMPIFTQFIPNPIEVHAYSIMPLSAAEPTPCIGAGCGP